MYARATWDWVTGCLVLLEIKAVGWVGLCIIEVGDFVQLRCSLHETLSNYVVHCMCLMFKMCQPVRRWWFCVCVCVCVTRPLLLNDTFDISLTLSSSCMIHPPTPQFLFLGSWKISEENIRSDGNSWDCLMIKTVSCVRHSCKHQPTVCSLASQTQICSCPIMRAANKSWRKCIHLT